MAEKPSSALTFVPARLFPSTSPARAPVILSGVACWGCCENKKEAFKFQTVSQIVRSRAGRLRSSSWKKKKSFSSDGSVFTEKRLTCNRAMKQQTFFLSLLLVPHTSSIFDAVTLPLKILSPEAAVREPPARRSSSAFSQRSANVPPTLAPVYNSRLAVVQS